MRIATAFYDGYGTLLAVPDSAFPHAGARVRGFPAVAEAHGDEVTVDAGYYHRFSQIYPTARARDLAAVDLTEILDLYNTSVIVNNSRDYYYELPIAQHASYRDNGLVVPRPGRRYVLDVVYVVEDLWRVPYHRMPGRHPDPGTVSDWYRHDPIPASGGHEPLPDPNEAMPDLMYL